MRKWLCLCLSIVALLAVSPAPRAQPAAALDGAWTALSAERDGRSAPDVAGNRLTFSGNRFAITRDGKTLFAGTYTADPGKQPAEIDFVNTEGNLKGTWKGIFRLNGATFAVCDNAPDMTKPRPTAFIAFAGSGYVCIVFRRD